MSSHKYKMKYMRQGQAEGGPRLDPKHKPITITVQTMAGENHTLVTENDKETIGDVKRCLINNLKPSVPEQIISIPREIVFRLGNAEMGYTEENLEDEVKIVSLLNHPLFIHLIGQRKIKELYIFKVEPTWTRDEQRVLNSTESGHFHISYDSNTGNDVFIWILKNKPELKHLTVSFNIPMPIVHAVIDAPRSSQSDRSPNRWSQSNA